MTAAQPETQVVVVQSAGRIDAVLARETPFSRSRIQQMIRDGQVTVGGAPVRANLAVLPGDAVTLSVDPPKPIDVEPEDIPLSIVYEDASVAVIDKPQGMVVHPAPGHADGTMVNALLYRLSDLSGVGGALRPGIVHRIDKMTSGLLVVAKNDAAHESLSAQFKTHAASRQYLALVDGNLREDAGTIDTPIGRSRSDRKKMAIVPDGRAAVTHWAALARFSTHTLIAAALETGRTHQIRVHMASAHHPVTGDPLYGARKPQLGLPGQALHGYRLAFAHPETGEPMRFYAKPPEAFLNALKKLGWDGDPEALLRAADAAIDAYKRKGTRDE